VTGSSIIEGDLHLLMARAVELCGFGVSMMHTRYYLTMERAASGWNQQSTNTFHFAKSKWQCNGCLIAARFDFFATSKHIPETTDR
jgi:hypothetical protein